MRNRPAHLLTLIVGITFIICCSTVADVATVSFKSHDLHLKFDVPSHFAAISDSGLIQLDSGWNVMYLNSSCNLTSLKISGQAVDYLSLHIEDSASFPDAIDVDLMDSGFEGDPCMILFESRVAKTETFQLSFEAEFFQDVSDIRFSNEMVGAEVAGSISEKGAYLSPAAYFYPRGKDELCDFKLTADIPADWECISDGNLLSTQVDADRKIVRFANPYMADGLMFMAGPYVVRTAPVGEIEVVCYFYEADTSLFEEYLTASADYITMYSELIGPYPYKRFSVVENFFPTGYGMPAWTLLGQQVLRLPFIKYTSLGHEVLHNWWGNSVYVDYERGNWCEAATVYGADYRYKLKRSPDAARAYRKDILKQYISYVNDGNDFPIREFKSRTSPDTRTIGYNKAMMVYHMIEQEIGTKAFFSAWQLVYGRHKTEKISWEEWVSAFKETSGHDLSYVIPQWIDMPGAPQLALEVIDVKRTDEGSEITFVVSEKSNQSYRLEIPVRFASANLSIDTSVTLAEEESQFTISTAADVETIELDPDYHLFRRLYPEEVEPIISGVLGVSAKRFFAPSKSEGSKAGFQSFAENFSRDSVQIETLENLDGASDGLVPILLNPTELPDYLASRVSVGPDSIVVDGTSYPKSDHTLVLAGGHWNDFEQLMVIITGDYESLPRIGQLVPHYGKYSYLVFNAARNVGKGQWSVDSSPLRKKL